MPVEVVFCRPEYISYDVHTFFQKFPSFSTLSIQKHPFKTNVSIPETASAYSLKLYFI